LILKIRIAGGREHGQKCDQLPGWRDIANPEHRAHVAQVWGMPPEDLPGPGVDAYEIFRKIDQGEIKGLLSLCFNPVVSLPDNHFVSRMLDKLEFYVAIDFFLNDSTRHADIVLPGSLQEEDEGIVTTAEGRIIKINKVVECPGEARQDWRIIQDIAQALQRPHGFTFASPGAILDELRHASQGGVADYYGVTYEKVERQYGVFWPCPSADHPGTPRLFEKHAWNPVAQGQGPFYFPDGKAHFNVVEYAPPVEETDAAYPLMLTTGRVVSHFLSGTQTRRIGPLVDHCPDPFVEVHPQLAARLGLVDGAWPGWKRAAARARSRCGWSKRFGLTRFSSRITGLASRARISSPSRRKIRCRKFPHTKSVRRACRRRCRRRRQEHRTGARRTTTMPVPEAQEFFIDPARCIGCNACVQACTECDTPKATP
jgi:assimilatory nitrate reductase catalytic subunit